MSKQKVVVMVVTCWLTCLVTGFTVFAQTEPVDVSQHPYLGVLLHPEPLPDWFFQHVDAPVGAGLRIDNVHIGSPADLAGIEQNDVILERNGQAASDPNRFVSLIRESKVGQSIELRILQRGRIKTVRITLGSRPETFVPKYRSYWKRLTAPVRVGKIYRLDPDRHAWIEVSPDLWDPNQIQQVQKQFQNQQKQVIDTLRDYVKSLDDTLHQPRPMFESDRRRIDRLEGKLEALRGRLDRIEAILQRLQKDETDGSSHCPI